MTTIVLFLPHIDYKAALKLVEPRDRLEKVIIRTLLDHKNGYNNAFYKISRNTRIIYIHAYQSYVWNKVVSDRIEKYGSAVLKGDLVSADADAPSEVDDEGEKASEDASKYMEVKVVEDPTQYTIDQVVMPLIGKSIQLPEHPDLKAMYHSYLEKDEITLEMFKSKSMEGGCAHGAYRHIISRGTDIEYDTVEFCDKDEDLLNPYYLTDKTELELPKLETSSDKFRAIRIKFSLPPSSYATMFIRELTHQH